MKSAITINDIFDAIEIELLQGSVAQDDLGLALQRIRHYQSQVRSELLANQKTPDLQDVVSRQFQINEMLLALFHEVISKQQQQQIDLRKSLLWATHYPIQTNLLPTETLLNKDQANTASTVRMDLQPSKASLYQPATIASSEIENIKAAMKEDKLILHMDVRPIGIPLIGSILARLRTLFHSLTLFYSNRLASRQASVNQVWGDNLLILHELIQQQNSEIVALQSQIAALQSVAAPLEQSAP